MYIDNWIKPLREEALREKMPTISIVIPTYNRADKLGRLLKNIEAEIIESNLSDLVHVLVSDNASSDGTQTIVSNFNTTKFNLSYFRQDKNIGFDGNVRFLYDAVKTDYVWLFADDDILLPNAIAIVMSGLKANKPDALLFSFIQPPGSKSRTFNLPEQYAIITNHKEIIRFVAYLPKISIYVFRKIELSEAQKSELLPFYENSFFFVDLCLSVISAADQPKLCVISQPLAKCDDDYSNTRFPVSVYLRMYTMLFHPFVRMHLPHFAEESRAQSYYNGIQFMFAVKMGSIQIDDQVRFKEDVKSLSILPWLLLTNPRAFMQFLLIKMNLVCIYKIYQNIFGRFAKIQT